MSITDQIAAVKAQIKALKLSELDDSKSLSDKHVIGHQVIEAQSNLIELYEKNAQSGKKCSAHSIRRISINLVHNEEKTIIPIISSKFNRSQNSSYFSFNYFFFQFVPLIISIGCLCKFLPLQVW